MKTGLNESKITLSREQYKKRIINLIEDDDYLKTNNIEDCIYKIDDVLVCAGIFNGIRGVEHNEIKWNDVSWIQILNWGNVIVPETRTYISNNPINLLDELGYVRLPLRYNHIVGYQNYQQMNEIYGNKN